MTFDHRTTKLHVADLDREIETIRTERSLANDPARSGLVDRARRGAGRVLIAAGETLGGRDSGFRTHRV